MPTVDGHDACLGTIHGISAACCGHDKEAEGNEPYVLTDDDQRIAFRSRSDIVEFARFIDKNTLKEDE